MSLATDSKPRRRLPNKNVGGEFSLRFDSIGVPASNGNTSRLSTIGAAPLVPLPNSGTVSRNGQSSSQRQHNFPVMQTMPLRAVEAAPLQVSGVPTGPSGLDLPKPQHSWILRPRSIALLLAAAFVTASVAFYVVTEVIPSSETDSAKLFMPPPPPPHHHNHTAPPPPALPEDQPLHPPPPPAPNEPPLPPPSPAPPPPTTELVTFTVHDVPVAALFVVSASTNQDILKAAVIENLPHFITEDDVTIVPNATDPTMLHVTVDCGVATNSAQIVKNVVLDPAFANSIEAETGFRGVYITGVQIIEILFTAAPPSMPPLPPSTPPAAPPSMPPPLLPSPSVPPPRQPPPVEPPAHPPPIPETNCYVHEIGMYYSGNTLGVGSDVAALLDTCKTLTNCEYVTRESLSDPWVMGYPYTSTVRSLSAGAETYALNQSCVAPPPPPAVPPPSPPPSPPLHLPRRLPLRHHHLPH